MAGTKASRGMKPFKMRSPETPYPFLGKIGKGLKNLVNKTPIGMAANAMKGGGSGSDDLKSQIAEIHEVVTSAKNEAEGGLIGNMVDRDEMALAKAAKAEESGLTKKVDSSMKHTTQTKYGLDDNTEHKYHTHHPNSPKHPDNQTKWKIDGKEVSYDEFQKYNHQWGQDGK